MDLKRREKETVKHNGFEAKSTAGPPPPLKHNGFEAKSPRGLLKLLGCLLEASWSFQEAYASNPSRLCVRLASWSLSRVGGSALPEATGTPPSPLKHNGFEAPSKRDCNIQWIWSNNGPMPLILRACASDWLLKCKNQVRIAKTAQWP